MAKSKPSVADEASEVEVQGETQKVIIPAATTVIIPKVEAVTNTKTPEEKIVEFLERNANGKPVRINEVLKSTFPPPKWPEPAGWLSQPESKRIKGMLAKMEADGLIKLEEAYKRLGGFFYNGSDPKTLFHTIENVPIYASKA
jgi:hypothetical protein